MTVELTHSAVDYACDGVQTAFPTTFSFGADTDLVVKVTTDAGVTTTQVNNVDYTVSGAGAAEPGGTVNFVTAPANDYTVTIERNTAQTQPTNFKTSGPFSPTTWTQAVDKLTREVQDLTRRIEALEALGETLGSSLGTISGSKVEVDFQTHVNVVENTFPLSVSVVSGSTAQHAWATYLENRDDGSEVFDEPPAIQWSPGAGSTISIKRISGLKPNTNYRLRLVVLQP